VTVPQKRRPPRCVAHIVERWRSKNLDGTGECQDYALILTNVFCLVLQLRVLSEQNEQVQADLSTYLNAVVLEALLSFCREEKREKVHVGEIADAVNEILERQGEPLHLSPRMMSDRWKDLGLPTKRLDAAGRGLLLHSGLRQRIYQLARDYRVVEGDEEPSPGHKPPSHADQAPTAASVQNDTEELGSPKWVENAQDAALVEKLKKEAEL
jgi:hypothetical protein